MLKDALDSPKIQHEMQAAYWRKGVFNTVQEALESWNGWQMWFHLYNWEQELKWNQSFWHI
jgi:hypothetical protein